MTCISETEDADDERAPICPYCGVTALPAETQEGVFVCENPDCAAFGDPVIAG
jgi:hypothetical protein